MPGIEDANRLTLAAYREKFLPTSLDQITVGTTPQQCWNITLESSSTISAHDLDTCFDLIASSSSKAYAASSIGWSPSKKRKETKLPDLRYLLLSNTKDPSSPTQGFLSFMLTYEDGYEVVYCYELHLAPSIHRQGLGKHLMGIMEGVGRKAGVEKSMLTVFVENQAALRFYEKLGYSKDDFSPEPRKMRNGTVKEPTYIILSKSLQGAAGAEY